MTAARVTRFLRRIASVVVGALELAGAIIFMALVGWVLLAARLVAGAAGARGVRP